MTGAEIRAFRAQKQMSQYQLAQLVGTTQNAVSKWEHNQSRPSGVYKARLEWLVHAAPEELQARQDEIRQEQAEERRKRRCANPVKPKKPPEKESVEPAKPATTKTANPCKDCLYWQHMDSAKSKTMYCTCLQETGHSRICGVERTYQRRRTLRPLSLDAARAAELGLSYGQYKARGGI